MLEASVCQQGLSPAWSQCLQSDPALCRHSEWDFLGASLKMEAWCPVASTGCILGVVFLQAGQEGLVEGCGEAGRELKRCSEVSCTEQMRRETNNAENRKSDVLGNYGPTPRAPAKEDGTSSMISGIHELQLLHSALVLQPDMFECSFSPSCPDTALAVPPCSGNAPTCVWGLSQVPSPPERVSQGRREGGRSQV